MKVVQPAASDIFEWDVNTWKRSLHVWEPVLNSVGPQTKVLELGARRAGLSQMFSMLGAEVLATDLRDVRDTVATPDSGRIRFKQVDATNFGEEIGMFDVVCFKSVLGGVGDRRAQASVISSIRRVLKPGGAVLFAENLTGSWAHMAMRRRFVGWGASWQYVTPDVLDEVFDGFDLELETFGLIPPLPNALRGVDGVRASAVFSKAEKVLPEGWRYVAAGLGRLVS